MSDVFDSYYSRGFGLGLMVGAVVLAIIMVGPLLFVDRQLDVQRQQAIDRGYAHYHPQTGDWKWLQNPVCLDECDKKNTQ